MSILKNTRGIPENAEKVLQAKLASAQSHVASNKPAFSRTQDPTLIIILNLSDE